MPEPAWVEHVVWWHVYPLGAVGAFPPADGHEATPEEHRLLRLVPWLDHVLELGANGIALGPVFASSTHGYDTVDHLRVDPRLGTDEDLDTLIGEAHARGIRVQLDGVFNHVGVEHPLVRRALADPPDEEALRWLHADRDADGRPVLGSWEGHGGLIELDHAAEEVRAYVGDVLRHWLGRGVDAWRLDVAYRVPTAFWAAVLPGVREAFPDAWFEGEVIHGDYAAFVRDSTVDSVTQYELWKAIRSSLESENLWELAWSLGRHDEMLAAFVPTTFVGNHDVTRIASAIPDARHRPHAVALLALLGGTPIVYAGDELGLTGVKEDRAGGDDAVRPELPAGGPSEVERADPAVLRLHELLLGVRRRHPWLHRATSETVELANERYLLRISAGDDALQLLLHLGDEPTGAPDAELVAGSPGAGPGHVPAHGWAVYRG